VRLALEALGGTPLRLAVLTHFTATSATMQMEHDGIDGYVEAMLSADAVQRFKSARESQTDV